MVTAWGGIAQLGERLLCKQEVSGSIPLASTTILPLPSAADLQKPLVVNTFVRRIPLAKAPAITLTCRYQLI